MGIFTMVKNMFIAILLGTIILYTTENFGIAIAVAIAILMISERERDQGE